MKIISIVGARPNFIKIAPFYHELTKYGSLFEHILLHTGQHYDLKMSEDFFRLLNIPEPDINLEVGSGTHAFQTAHIMLRFEDICLEYRPDWIVVVGDVNSTMACTLVASKLGIRVAHIEAGLRSFDRSMPEEINRLVTDALADLLFTPSPDADENLLREGIPLHKIKWVGNIMIDTLTDNLNKALASKTFEKWGLKVKEFVYVTLHRPSNVDDKITLSAIWEAFKEIADETAIVFPLHPRTLKKLKEFALFLEVSQHSNIYLTEPLNYHESICLAKNADVVITDSGGLQEETTFLKTQCLTLRPNTERPITINEGTNKLTTVDSMVSDFQNIQNGNRKEGRIPEYWDGNTAERVVKELLAFC